MCVLHALQEFEEDCGDEPRLGSMPGQSMGRHAVCLSVVLLLSLPGAW